MIKSTKKSLRKEEKPLTFPVLMEHIGPGNGAFVVLFTDRETGFVVSHSHIECDKCIYPIGMSLKNWIFADCKGTWRKYEGQITLKND